MKGSCLMVCPNDIAMVYGFNKREREIGRRTRVFAMVVVALKVFDFCSQWHFLCG